jgi:hypothetical protein
MNSTSLAQAVVKLVRYLPFFTSGVLIGTCRFSLKFRDARAALLFGLAMGLVLLGWLARYFLEERAPQAYYDVPATAQNILAIGLSGMAYDVLMSAACVVAYACVTKLVPPRAPPS